MGNYYEMGVILKVNDWKIELTEEFQQFINSEYETKDIAPNKDKLYYALELTSLRDVKVVIFGQDPYPTKGVATGLAFSSNGKLPPSLKNMYKELETDLGISRTDPNLEDLAKQGILLLNTSLSVEVGKPGSHSKIGWMNVTNQVIDQINNLDRPVVFVLLGNHAQGLKSKINDKHIILEYTHPSPLSAYRGFFGCKMFSTINRKLVENDYEEIKFEDKNLKLF